MPLLSPHGQTWLPSVEQCDPSDLDLQRTSSSPAVSTVDEFLCLMCADISHGLRLLINSLMIVDRSGCGSIPAIPRLQHWLLHPIAPAKLQRGLGVLPSGGPEDHRHQSSEGQRPVCGLEVGAVMGAVGRAKQTAHKPTKESQYQPRSTRMHLFFLQAVRSIHVYTVYTTASMDRLKEKDSLCVVKMFCFTAWSGKPTLDRRHSVYIIIMFYIVYPYFK